MTINKYLMVISVVLLIVCTVLGWQYYQKAKEQQQIITSAEDSIASQIYTLQGLLKPLTDVQKYSESHTTVWVDMEKEIAKLLQAIDIRRSIHDPVEVTTSLSTVRTTFSQFSYFIRDTQQMLVADHTYEVGSCDNVIITTDEDINKRLSEYYHLIDDFDLARLSSEGVEDVQEEFLNIWDEQQAYQVNSCSNW